MDSTGKDVDPKEEGRKGPKDGKKKESKRCPWNWRTMETMAAVTASLSASETHGEQESADLFNNCADEYIAAVNQMVVEGKWHVNGSAACPKAVESQQWRAEGVDPAHPSVLLNPEVPRGRSVWRHWIDLKRQINNEINPVLKEYIISQSSALGKTFSLHSGTNWEEVITEVRVAIWRNKTNPRPGKKMEEGWTTSAFEVWMAWGEAAAKDGKECHPALALEAAARKKGLDDVTAGRSFLRHQSKKVKKTGKADIGAASAIGATGAAPGTTAAELSISPATKMMLDEIKGVREAMDTYNRRQDIAMALQFCKDPAMQHVLAQSVLGLPGVQTLMGGRGQASPASNTVPSVAETEDSHDAPSLAHNSMESQVIAEDTDEDL